MQWCMLGPHSAGCWHAMVHAGVHAMVHAGAAQCRGLTLQGGREGLHNMMSLPASMNDVLVC